jgi:hypothetical protein
VEVGGQFKVCCLVLGPVQKCQTKMANRIASIFSSTNEIWAGAFNQYNIGFLYYSFHFDCKSGSFEILRPKTESTDDECALAIPASNEK